MHIFHLCAGAAHGGAEAAFVDTCLALHGHNGFVITAICRPHEALVRPLRAAGITVHPLPFGGMFDFVTKPTIRRLIKQLRPAIVQTWMNRAARFCPAPRAHMPPFRLVARLGGYYNLKYYKHADHFIANTPDIKRYLTESGIAPARVTAINNLVTIDTDVAPLEKPPGQFVFLTMARLHPVKGLDDFIKAFTHLPETAHGWIAGEGPERAALEALTRKLNMTNRIMFLGWRSDKDALLKTADALVVPSRFEPFGNSFAQAWAAGCPLITTDSQGPSQYVTDGQDALMVPMNDPPAMAAAMMRLMSDPPFARSIAANGMVRYQNLFARDTFLKAYENLYADTQFATFFCSQ